MKKVKKTLIFISTIILAIFIFCTAAFAHAGKTDEYGGHFDGETGEYHYHHGYPAHQHPNGICPYDYDDNANHSSGNLSSSSTTSEYTTVEHQSTTKHNIYPNNNSSNYIFDNFMDNTSSVKKIAIIGGLVLIAIVIKSFLSIRKNIRRKKSLYYASILKRQLKDIKEEEITLIYKSYNYLNAELNNLTKKKYNIERRNYIKLFSEHTIEELCDTPKGIKIINDKIIDEMSNKEYGRYTAYKTYSGKAIHFKKGCSGSYIPINLLSLNYNDKRKKPCKICYSPKKAKLINHLPEWYLKYTEIVKIKEKYNIK